MKACLLIAVTACFLTGCYPPMLGQKPVAKEAGIRRKDPPSITNPLRGGEKVAKASIRRTDPGIQRSVVFASAPLGGVNSIMTISNQGKPMIAVGGHRGAAFLTDNYVQDRFVPFTPTNHWLRTTVPVDVEGDGRYEFMDRGGGWSPVKLLSAEGRLLWHFPEKDSSPAADQMAAGDLDGDGFLDFVVGMNGSGGLYAFAKDRSIKWRHEASNVSSVEILDLDDDGKLEIVHIDGRYVVVRDNKGVEIRRFEFPVHPLRPLVWKLNPEGVFIVGTKDGFIHRFNPFGNKVSTVRLPQGEGDPEAVQPVRFGGSLYYAAATKVSYADKIGYLYIFTESGQILRDEVFTERVEALAAVPRPQHPDSEILLVGVGTQVIGYRKEARK